MSYFGKYVDLKTPEILNALKESIKKHLRRGDKYVYDIIESYNCDYIFLDEPWEESIIYTEFSQEIELCEKKLEELRKKKEIEENQLPF